MKPIEKIQVIQGDITKVKTEAIVNAANTSLLGGGGVDGAIHRAGGKDILNECIKIRDRQGGCEVGEAVITTGGNLAAKYVIHTVGPVWNGGHNKEEMLLANAYRNSLRIAVENDVKSIAFPGISTGIFRFPKQKAALIALKTVIDFLEQDQQLDKVLFVAFDMETLDIYEGLIQNYKAGS